jgi:histidyl-tRNA synthetase
MAERIQAIRGMNDVLPDQSFAWRHLEKSFVDCLTAYGYQEIRFPLLETTSLFKRTIGEVTDIVEKEMYTFDDLNGDSLSLRPEGTAGCLRACLEHGLLHNQQQKLWYYGPMFRHEKPQKGRYRQFHQFGVEVIGVPGVGVELELLLMCQRLWQELGIQHAVTLEINTLGDFEERQTYRNVLIDYLKLHLTNLDQDSQRRLERNPLRILDSKNPEMKAIIVNAPKLIDVVGETSRAHFEALCAGLKELGIAYQINPFLVRGLDYYGQTVFEWTTDKLGSQSTICAGGRYDRLVEQLGGQALPAIGFAMGAERLLLLTETLAETPKSTPTPAIFFIVDSEAALPKALKLAESLRQDHQLQIVVNTALGSFKSQFKKADKSGARLALILGQDEVKQGTLGVKDLRQVSDQVTIQQSELNRYISSYFSGDTHVSLHD